MRWYDSEAGDLDHGEVWAEPSDPPRARSVILDEYRGTWPNFGGQYSEVSPGPLGIDLGPYSGLVDDDTTDLLINGPHSVWTDSSTGLRRVDRPPVIDETALREFAARLIAQGGRHLDHATPCVDARLAGGVRVHAAIPPVAVMGTAVSVRFPRAAALRLDALVASGSIDERDAERLAALVVGRANLLITGASGAGKTTLLGALLAEAAPSERILTVEDVAELRIDHPHVVALETRQANTEAAGEVSLTELVRQALRMRPDRLVVGECRGAEVRDLLLALGSGHDGGASTLHARSLEEVGTRLETLGALAGLEGATLARMVVCAIDVVVHVEREGGRRRIAAIGRPLLRDDTIAVEPLG